MPARRTRCQPFCGHGWALAGLLLVLVIAACGGGGTAAPRGVAGAAEQILTRADIDDYPSTTPERALLEWWRDMQYANVTGYVDAFQPTVKERLVRDPETPEALAYFSGSIRVARPVIVSVERRNQRATIYAQIEYRTPIGTTRYVTSSRPQAFVLLLRAGRWLLQSDSFVQTSLPARLRRDT